MSNATLPVSRQWVLLEKPKKQSKLSPQTQRIHFTPQTLTCSGDDAATIGTASSALQSASDGIKTIAGALLSGQTAPASARDQVGTGLETALSALSNVTSVYV
jgi:hypothetical protein